MTTEESARDELPKPNKGRVSARVPKWVKSVIVRAAVVNDLGYSEQAGRMLEDQARVVQADLEERGLWK